MERHIRVHSHPVGLHGVAQLYELQPYVADAEEPSEETPGQNDYPDIGDLGREDRIDRILVPDVCQARQWQGLGHHCCPCAILKKFRMGSLIYQIRPPARGAAECRHKQGAAPAGGAGRR